MKYRILLPVEFLMLVIYSFPSFDPIGSDFIVVRFKISRLVDVYNMILNIGYRIHIGWTYFISDSRIADDIGDMSQYQVFFCIVSVNPPKTIYQEIYRSSRPIFRTMV